jgi:hypothetical protein
MAIDINIESQVSQTITNGVTNKAPSENVVFDALALKQNTLVSGTNIKTINGNSLLGAGNIDIQSFVLEGTNYLSVLAQGSPQANGQAVKDAYSFAQTMTPNGNALSANNRVVILLATGLYSFDEASNGQFIVNTSFIDFESLSGQRDVYFSSIEVLSQNNGLDVRLSGIDTTAIGYYFHSSFAVSSTAGLFENIVIKNCKGGDFSFSSFSSGFIGVYENCEANDYSFGSTGAGFVPPPGISGIPTAFLGFNNYGNFKNCTALNYSFCTSGSFGANVQNYGIIDNCFANDFSFCTANAGNVENYATIKNCESQSSSFVFLQNGSIGMQANNIGNIINCKGVLNCFAVHSGNWNSISSAQNFGTFSNCIATGNSFAVNPVNSIGANWGSIFNCTSTGNNSFMGRFGENSNKINNCLTSTGLCSDNPTGIYDDMYRCTLTNSAFVIGATGGGRVILGIDTTGIVNY